MRWRQADSSFFHTHSHAPFPHSPLPHLDSSYPFQLWSKLSPLFFMLHLIMHLVITNWWIQETHMEPYNMKLNQVFCRHIQPTVFPPWLLPWAHILPVAVLFLFFLFLYLPAHALLFWRADLSLRALRFDSDFGSKTWSQDLLENLIKQVAVSHIFNSSFPKHLG